MAQEVTVDLVVNGEPVRRLVPANRSLLEMLREELNLTGTKHGCDLGDCGACTVLVDGEPRLSCITLAAQVQGADVLTIEGLGDNGILHPLQQSLHKHVAAQCGYCTPGIALCLSALMRDNPKPDDQAIREALGANICRCTGYTKILAAVRESVGRPAQGGKAAGSE